MTASGRRWRLRGRFPEGALEGAPYPTLMRHLLWHRGLRTAAEAQRFMEGPPQEYDPMLLPDIEVALSRLEEAVRSGERIAVYGDFDVDGVTASALMVEGLSALDGDAIAYIPDRFSEGYGLNCGALDRLRKDGATLLVAVDCGTSSIVEVAHARKLGMDVLILDHHSVPPELPAATALVNPKRPDSRYPEPELASVGIAYKLMGALHESMGRSWDGDRQLDLVALGTVADVAPLLNENRWLLKRGLKAMGRSERPGLRALMEASGIDAARVDAESIGYRLAPRLNAAGRLKHARLALELLLERDEGEALRRAEELTALNLERQERTTAALELAAELLAEDDPDQTEPLLFLGHEDIPSGIVGLVAGRLAEERHRPAVVYERQAETSRASCRSIPEFDITGALRGCAELLERFGGHRAAAGFTARNENLEPLKEGLLRAAEEALAGVELAPVIDIDAALPLGALRGKETRLLSQMGPFGQGNPEPTFLSRGVEVADCRIIGSDGKHLRMKLRDQYGAGGGVTWPAIAFGLGEAGVREGQRLDVVYSLAADRRGNGLELRVKDVAATEQNQEARS
ncbi:MAG: single-stranded-DNA-specific exonuclease RecJ [Chloroflexi bacterium]|nr:single-stranded-DNA-specific exonuclease RecJ [Chloroflexota bacterium]